MRFSLTADQKDLRDAAKSLLEERAPLGVSRALTDAGRPYDAATWRELVEMGVVTVDLPEALGGTGLGMVELAVVMEVAGSVLYPGPLMSTCGFAAGLIGDDDASTQLGHRLADGTVLAAVVPGQPRGWHADSVTVAAEDSASGWRLSGSVRGVLGADVAELLVVAARTDEGDVAIFSVEPSSASIIVESGLDAARPLCTVILSDAGATLVQRSADERLHRAGLRAATALAAESVGAARAALDLTVEHVRTRRQFDQPIGAFQAVRHRLADLLTEIELSTSAVYLAALHVGAGDTSSAAASVPLAVHSATGSLQRAAASAVQLHGGLGFTWESACHWFVSWAEMSRWLLGSPAGRLEEMFTHAPSLSS
jgi:alkylation response protein AidB-like acyl-CoA dehydrogenase